jgi:hypothetical protein
MKFFKQQTIQLCIFFAAFTFGSFEQKAVLFNFEFQVPEDYRRAIQQFDAGGNKQYINDPYSNKRILDKQVETLSKKEVNRICEMAAELFKKKSGYSEVTIVYPLNGYNGFNRLDDFPNINLKKAIKKRKADAYISMEINIESKEPFVQWSDVLGEKTMEYLEVEKIMYMNVTASYTIYNIKKEIIDKKELVLNDFIADFNKYFNNSFKKVDKKGRYKLRKPYFSKSEIIDIYYMVEQKFAAIE